MTLKLHHLRPAPGPKTAKTRVGRGEASKGKTAGRGTKGTKARDQVPASFEGGQMPIHMRLPKLKGFKNPFKVEFQVVNLDRINDLFPDGGDRTRSTTSSRRAPSASGHPVKVLGQGDLAVKVQVTANAFSASAKEKIEAAGGTPRWPDRHRSGRHDHADGRGRVPRRGRVARARRASEGLSGSLLGFPGSLPFASSLSSHRGAASRLEKEDLVLSAFANAFRTPDLRRKLLFVLMIIVIFRLGSQVPAPGVNVANVQSCIDQVSAPGSLQPGQPVLRRRAAPADDLRAGDHAVHHGEHHPAAAGRGDPAARGPEEGGPGRADEDHPVHPLPDARPRGPPGDRHRRARPLRQPAAGLHPQRSCTDDSTARSWSWS